METDTSVETIGQIFGNVIEILQKVKGIKNKDFQVYGISSSQLSQIKAGTKIPSIDRLYQLSEGLHVPMSAIIGFVEDQQKNRSTKARLMSRICEQIDELDCKENAYRDELSRICEDC